MNATFWLPLAVVLSSMIPGLLIFTLREDQVRTRTILNLGGALLKLGLIAVILFGVYRGVVYETRIPVMPGFDLVLGATALPMFFVVLSGLLWLITTIYAIGYLDLEGSWHRSRFFGFFSICVSATTGIALAGNLFSFVIFYELLTLATYPLVVHDGTKEAIRAGKIYLIYTLTGGAILLLAVVWMHSVVGPFDFQEGGVLSAYDEEYRHLFVPMFLMLLVGLGVKAAMVPLHSWLPIAMVAPAPVSALLHAVAVVKAGAYGIVRVVYDVYGIHYFGELRLGRILVTAASVTIIYGSLQALVQDSLKRRLAFSTVSQVSFIMLGVGLIGPVASIGGIVHLVHQGLMKITLFFCAGNIAETLGLKKISDMAGIGRRMPLTMAAFTVASMGMIGVPPLAGFITKWYLGMGALDVGQSWVLIILVASSVLNAAYFLPIIYAAYFKDATRPWPKDDTRWAMEARPALVWPTVATASLMVLAGVFAAAPLSPVAWIEIVLQRIYPPR